MENPKKNWIDSENITAWATVILVLVTIFYAWTTHSILNQEKKSESIQNRAYLSFHSGNIIVNNAIGDPQKYQIVFEIENNGYTPAQNIKKERYWIVGENLKKVDDSIDIARDYIGPSQGETFRWPVSEKDITIMNESSGNYLMLKIIYEDYNQQEHVLVGKFRVTNLVDNNYSLTVYEQYEEKR